MRKEWLLLIPAVLLYFYAPDSYNWGFCFLCSILFILGAIFVMLPEMKKGVFLSFNLIFFFSYFWTSFAYPVLIYGTNADRGNVFNRVINWNQLSHTSALALLFIVAYIVGFSYHKKKAFSDDKVYRSHYKVPYVLYSVCLVVYLGLAIIGFVSLGRRNMAMGKYMIDIFFTIYTICLFVNTHNNKSKYDNTLANFLITNAYLVTTGVLVFLTFVVLGDRMPAIKMALTIIAVYYLFWEKIKIRHMVVCAFFFLLLLFFVRQTRGSNVSIVSGNITGNTIESVFDIENGPLFMFADLFYINRELNLGYEYAQKHELYHPESIVIAPLYPFPILPSFVSNALFGVSPADMQTVRQLNAGLDYEYDIEGHLGNHPASDLLMSYGLLGMLLIAYLLGRCIGYIQSKYRSNFYMGICYIVLIGWSLYLARSVVVSLIRPVGYVFLFGYLLYRIPIFKSRKR